MTFSDSEIRALNSLRRHPHAATLQRIAVRAAAAARERYEVTPSTEENRLKAAEANDVIVALFSKEL